jgi:hypothetical protein
MPTQSRKAGNNHFTGEGTGENWIMIALASISSMATHFARRGTERC